jgi:hypothetical protein
VIRGATRSYSQTFANIALARYSAVIEIGHVDVRKTCSDVGTCDGLSMPSIVVIIVGEPARLGRRGQKDLDTDRCIENLNQFGPLRIELQLRSLFSGRL